MQPTPNHVLVTGAEGFIGSHLVERLSRAGASVTALGNRVDGAERRDTDTSAFADLRRVDLVRDDLRPLLSERAFETVFHLAGNTDLAGALERPREDLEKNLLSTLNLLEAVRDVSPGTKILHASSAYVYGAAVTGSVTEDTPTIPQEPYGVSKLAAENYTSVFARRFGLATANLRLFSVFGPRVRKLVVYDLIRKVANNPEELVIEGDGSQERDLSHVSNVVEAFLVVAERAPLQGEAYNVASGEKISIEALAMSLCQTFGTKPRLVFTGADEPGRRSRIASPDISKIRSLGYAPHIGLADGLSDTVRWFLADSKNGAGLSF